MAPLAMDYLLARRKQCNNLRLSSPARRPHPTSHASCGSGMSLTSVYTISSLGDIPRTKKPVVPCVALYVVPSMRFSSAFFFQGNVPTVNGGTFVVGSQSLPKSGGARPAPGISEQESIIATPRMTRKRNASLISESVSHVVAVLGAFSYMKTGMRRSGTFTPKPKSYLRTLTKHFRI